MRCGSAQPGRHTAPPCYRDIGMTCAPGHDPAHSNKRVLRSPTTARRSSLHRFQGAQLMGLPNKIMDDPGTRWASNAERERTLNPTNLPVLYLSLQSVSPRYVGWASSRSEDLETLTDQCLFFPVFFAPFVAPEPFVAFGVDVALPPKRDADLSLGNNWGANCACGLLGEGTQAALAVAVGCCCNCLFSSPGSHCG